MSPPHNLKPAIKAATDRIWLEEPDEIRGMRLGVFTSDAGDFGQYFSNLVFVNGDMRALSTWITPSAILNCVADDSFTLEQCKRVFAWTNIGNVDFLAYCGFVKFGEFAHRIVESYDEIATKDQLSDVLTAWYTYANRLYMWVHQVFPWALGTAFPKVRKDDLAFLSTALASKDVERYFERYTPALNDFAGTGSIEAVQER